MGGISIACAVLNELVCKPFFRDPRPPQSANRKSDGSMKYGMPSGHVLNAFAVTIWVILEILTQAPSMESIFKVKLLMFFLAIALPVPWARWYNLDHTWQQCLVGLILASVFGFVAYATRLNCFPGFWVQSDWEFE